MSDDRPTTKARDIGDKVERLDETRTAERIKSIASRGLKDSKSVSHDEVQELCGSVMAHIERHGPLKR